MRLDDWIFHFVRGFRYASSKARTEDLGYLEPFLKEQVLAKPCQIEAIKFSSPYRLVLLFFFDKTKPDLAINIRKGKWSAQQAIIKTLVGKFAALKIAERDFETLIGRCRKCPNSLIYAIDFAKGICRICWMHDPRKKGTAFPWNLGYITDPHGAGEMVFSLNLNQASTYSQH